MIVDKRNLSVMRAKVIRGYDQLYRFRHTDNAVQDTLKGLQQVIEAMTLYIGDWTDHSFGGGPKPP